MKKVIKYAKFHQSVFVPGLGELGTTLPSLSKRILDLRMETDGNTLQISANGQAILIPLPNVIVMHVDTTASDEAVAPVVVDSTLDRGTGAKPRKVNS